jgi:predicted aldo/keto reductase-like oxidoreductase
MVTAPSDFLFDALFEAADEAKRAGKLGHLAISGHSGGMQECLKAAIEDGRIEMFFFKYDFVSYPDQDEILRRAASQGIGSIVFKVGAGNRQGEIRDLEAGGLSFAQASIRWALTNPDVSSVAVRIRSFDQLRQSAAAAGSKLTRNESDMLHRYAGEVYDKYCRFCGTCEAACPHGVAVADVMRYAMYFKYQGREKDAMRMYAALPGSRTAARCRDCGGPCEGACPFGRRLRPELAEADRLLRLSRA